MVNVFRKILNKEKETHLAVWGSGNRGRGRCDGCGIFALLLLPHKNIAHDKDEDSVAQVDAHQNKGQHVSGIVSGCTAQKS